MANKKLCNDCGDAMKQERLEHEKFSYLRQWYYVCTGCGAQEEIDTSVFSN